jgi:hypothetical protein
MADPRQRRDFIIKDLVVSIPSASGRGRGSTFMPAEDGDPLPPWLSPVAGVLVKGRVLEAATATVIDAVKKGGDFKDIGLAFREGTLDGDQTIRRAIHDIGSAVVASAAYGAIGGNVMPNPDDPNCGSSLETIPPTLTPIVHLGIEVHRVNELPGLRKQLAVAVEALDRLALAQAPQGADIKVVAEHLQDAILELGAPQR